MTYPPAPLNGLLVGGLLVPHPRSSFTYPEELRDELGAEVGNLMPDPSRTALIRRTVRGALAWLGTATELRTRMFLHLMRRQRWDLFVGVYRTTDVVQHAFLGRAARVADRPYEMAGRGGRIIAGHYEQVDAAIGQLLAEAPPDTSVIVMSDHGANVKAHTFFTNEWLAHLGLLKWSRWPLFGESGGAVKHVTVGRQLQSLRMTWLGGLLPTHWLDRQISVPRESTILHLGRSIDWPRTRAFCDPTMPEGVRINMRGRERDGIVEAGEEYERVVADIIQAAGETTAGDADSRLLSAVRRDELYSGPYAGDGPDVVLVTEEVSLRREPCRRGFARPARGLLRAGHSSEGILVASGAAFRRCEQPTEASIVDLAPTILYLLGAPVPQNADGRVLTELLSPWVTAGHPVEYAPEAGTREPRAAAPTEPPDERVLRRLRDLGYL
jgi:predicted AlkP superfamily phosphohydrolase/phosphomutase